jgi:hypothetical protein
MTVHTHRDEQELHNPAYTRRSRSSDVWADQLISDVTNASQERENSIFKNVKTGIFALDSALESIVEHTNEQNQQQPVEHPTEILAHTRTTRQPVRLREPDVPQVSRAVLDDNATKQHKKRYPRYDVQAKRLLGQIKTLVYGKNTSKAPLVLAVSLFIVGLCTFGVYLSKDRQTTSRVASATTERQPSSDTTPPVSIATMAAEEIVQDSDAARTELHLGTMSIESLNISSRITKTDLAISGDIELPSNTNDVAQYSAGSDLNGMGVMTLVGFSKGPSHPGALSKLGDLSIGETIEILNKTGEKSFYSVSKVEKVAAADSTILGLLNTVDTVKQGLVIISCGGAYTDPVHDFSDRVFVYATKI